MKRFVLVLIAFFGSSLFAQSDSALQFSENTFSFRFTNPNLLDSNPLKLGPFDVDRWQLSGFLRKCVPTVIPADPPNILPQRLDAITTCQGIANEQGIYSGRFESLNDIRYGSKKFKLDIAFDSPTIYRELTPESPFQPITRTFESSLTIKLNALSGQNPTCTSPEAQVTFDQGTTILVFKGGGGGRRTLNVQCLSPALLVSVEGDAALIQKLELTKGVRSCDVSLAGRNLQFWQQGEAPWGAQPIANIVGKPMSKYGCAVTSLAMLMKSYGITSTPNLSPLNPGTLNEAMASPVPGANTKVAFSGSNVKWEEAARLARLGAKNECVFSGQNLQVCESESKQRMAFKRLVSNAPTLDPGELNLDQITRVENEICAGNPVILELRKSDRLKRGEQHFVLAVGFRYNEDQQKTFVLYNPGSLEGRNQELSDISPSRYTGPVGFRLYRPSVDPSILHLWSSTNVDMILTDPLGKKVGFNPITGEFFDEIEGASYALQSTNTPAELGPQSEVLLQQHELVLTEAVTPGQYRLEILGTAASTFQIEVLHTDVDGDPNEVHLYSGEVGAGQTQILNLNHVIEKVVLAARELKLEKVVLRSARKCAHNSHMHVADVFDVEAKGKTNNILSINRSVEVIVGGASAFRKTLPARLFKKVGSNKNPKWKFESKQGDHFIVDSRGNFELGFRDVNLEDVPESGRGYVYINIDGDALAGRADLSCKGNKCQNPGID